MFLVKLIGENGFKVDAEFIYYENDGIELRGHEFDPVKETKVPGRIVFFAPIASVVFVRRVD